MLGAEQIGKMWQAPWSLPYVVAMILLIGFIVMVLLRILLRRGDSANDARLDKDTSNRLDAHDHAAAKGFLEMRLVEPCAPAGAAFTSNALDVRTWENDICTGSLLILHKPTADKHLYESGSYPYAAHMHDRKRLWEFRWQITPKKLLDGDSWFGIQQETYQPVRGIQRFLSENLLMALRQVCQFYQSYGDNPSTAMGEVESPMTVISLQTTDQFVVTAPGEKPPSLCDPNFSQLGLTKADDRKAFRQAVEGLKLKPGFTYTFGFWSVARFIDAVGWRSIRTGVAPSLEFKSIGIHPPCYFVQYALTTDAESKDKRHVPSRQKYYMKAVYWSSMVPVSLEKAAEFLPKTLLHSQRGKRSDSSKLSSRKGRNSCLCMG